MHEVGHDAGEAGAAVRGEGDLLVVLQVVQLGQVRARVLTEDKKYSDNTQIV